MVKHKACMLAVCALLLFGTEVWADHHRGPAGFYGSGCRQMSSVDEVYRFCHDDDYISLKGRLTRYFGDEDYEFSDELGATIEVELDDDRDWSYIAKDELIEIFGEVDRDDFRVKIDVKHARKLP